ncbi:MAG: hypothetical protein IPM42_21155 [Saprospiraceae bacterium]|nr:hypothetical protein [Saprospiraceae bacterium]
MRPICYLLLFIFVSCREKLTFNEALEITVSNISQKELNKKINEIKTKEHCPDYNPFNYELHDNDFNTWNFKNVNKNDIYLFSGNNWNVLLGFYGFDDKLGFRAVDNTYTIESPIYNPCIITLKKGDEFFIYFDNSQQGDNKILHYLHKLKYFDANDSIFYTIWIRYPDLKIYRSHLDYIKEYKNYFTEKRFSELYESLVYSDSISSEEKKESEALFLKSIGTKN